MTVRIYCSKCGKEMWTDWSHNPPLDEASDESVICADCIQDKNTKGFITSVSNLFNRFLGRERSAEGTSEEQAAALIMEGARFLVQAVEFDPRLKPIVRETIQVLQQGVMKLANADSGGDF